YSYLLFANNPEIRQKYETRFQYVLVDEYQDTNYAQHEIVWQLTEHRQKVCVVGDDAQSIYSFRGANIDNILTFQNRYSDARLFKLEQNYRSTQTIVKAANSLIRRNRNQIPKEVFSRNDEGERLHVCCTHSDIEEGKVVIGSIRRVMRMDGCGYNDFAILYRTNAQSRVFEDTLRKEGMPYRIYGGLSFYQRKEIKDVIAYFRMTVNPHDEEAFKRIINYPTRGIGATTVMKISQQATEYNTSLWNVISNPLEYGLSVSGATMSKIQTFRDMIESFISLAQSSSANTIGIHIMRESGVMKDIYQDRSPENLARQENIEELVNGLQDFYDTRTEEGNTNVSLTDYLSEVSLLSDVDSDDSDNGPKVTLMTVHSAKGLEFNTVHIAGCDEEIFPLIRGNMLTSTSERNEQLEEERRLFYVGCTRAEKKLYLYHAERRFYQGSIRPFAPSRFLKELDEAVVEFTPCINEGYSLRNSGIPSVNRSSMANSSIRKNDKHIVYKNSVVVKKMVPSEPRVVYDEYSENPFHPGVTVRHSKFGVGVITKCSGTGENAKVDVRFKGDGSVRSIVLKYAALEIIG
ncbi:MAG: UvrD-helicase domain-containing protein, partial [Bacteroidaceae bacterium]|nr:UvrD-helicase domain-containing protein [Bacteroidaceae bacterium]